MKGKLIQKCISILTLIVFSIILNLRESTAENLEPKIYLTENQRKLILAYWRLNEDVPEVYKCDIVSDEKKIKSILNSSAERNIELVNEGQFQEILSDCDNLPTYVNRRAETTTPSTNTTEDESSWNIIFPGTKWCGAGDVAKNYDDLGLYADTDKCCRAHDLCDDILKSGESKGNLTNTSPFTKLSCQCDDDFYDCLADVNSLISNKIGNLYFNILRRECYKFDHQETRKCKKYRSFLKITCKEYEKDTKGPKVYQWVKPKMYKQFIPIPGITLPF